MVNMRAQDVGNANPRLASVAPMTASVSVFALHEQSWCTPGVSGARERRAADSGKRSHLEVQLDRLVEVLSLRTQASAQAVSWAAPLSHCSAARTLAIAPMPFM